MRLDKSLPSRLSALAPEMDAKLPSCETMRQPGTLASQTKDAESNAAAAQPLKLRSSFVVMNCTHASFQWVLSQLGQYLENFQTRCNYRPVAARCTKQLCSERISHYLPNPPVSCHCMTSRTARQGNLQPSCRRHQQHQFKCFLESLSAVYASYTFPIGCQIVHLLDCSH
jgi:hypothetical protein